jgi:hypothetical protein
MLCSVENLDVLLVHVCAASCCSEQMQSSVSVMVPITFGNCVTRTQATVQLHLYVKQLCKEAMQGADADTVGPGQKR